MTATWGPPLQSHVQLRERWTMKTQEGNVVPDCQQWKPQWDFVKQGEGRYRGWEKGPGEPSKNLWEMYHRAITLTDRHPFLISMQKKDQWVFEGRKRQPFIFRFGCSWSGDSTSFWGERTMKRAEHLHKNTCLYSTTGRGGGVFNSAMAFTCWE